MDAASAIVLHMQEQLAAKDAEIAGLQKKVASLHESLKLGGEAHDTYVRLTNPMDGLARELKLERERDEAPEHLQSIAGCGDKDTANGS